MNNGDQIKPGGTAAESRPVMGRLFLFEKTHRSGEDERNQVFHW